MKNNEPSENTALPIDIGRLSAEDESDSEIMRKKYLSEIENVRKKLGLAQGTLDEVRSLESLNRKQLKHKL